MIVGLISDTHGTLSGQARAALTGVDHILHAGDIGSAEVLKALSGLAPVTSVRGNTDHGGWAQALPKTEMVALGGIVFYLLHDMNTLDLDPAAAGVRILVHGHTHKPDITRIHEVLYINPGSAAQQRQGGPLSIARVTLAANGITPEIILLNH